MRRHPILAVSAFALWILFAAGPASASIVTFYATGQLGSGTYSGANAGSMSLSFAPKYTSAVPFSKDVDQPFLVKYGTFTMSKTSNLSGLVTINDVFTLSIFASSPQAGSATITGQLTGTYDPQLSTAQFATLVFTGQPWLYNGMDMMSVQIGNVVYGVKKSITLGLNNKVSGHVDGYATPEPATYGLLSCAGLLAGIIIRRRNAKAAA
jgi:hypothetical protein